MHRTAQQRAAIDDCEILNVLDCLTLVVTIPEYVCAERAVLPLVSKATDPPESGWLALPHSVDHNEAVLPNVAANLSRCTTNSN